MTDAIAARLGRLIRDSSQRWNGAKSTARASAQANAERNGVTPLVSFDSRPIEEIARCGRDGDGFDLVVANLLAPVIRDLGPALVAATSPGGALVVSGLLADRWAEAVATLEDRDMTVEAVDEDEGWVAVVLLHRVRHARLPAAT